MKKILLATAAIALTAGAASADGVSISGYGRFGISYNKDRATLVPAQNKTQITSRLRLNIVATKTTDSGVEFGGQFRMQHDQNTTGGMLNAAKFWAKSGAFKLEVGNISDAIDLMSTIYNSEVGLLASSAGDPSISFIGYASGPYAAANTNAVGVGAIYEMGSVILRASYLTPDQTGVTAKTPAAGNAETAVSVDYHAGNLSLGAGYVSNGAYTTNNDYIVSAEYALGSYNIGAIYQDGDTFGAVGDKALITLYGNTTFGATTVNAYVASGGPAGSSTGVGLGVGYDIGGATLLGSIQRTLAKNTVADFGVKFSF